VFQGDLYTLLSNRRFSASHAASSDPGPDGILALEHQSIQRRQFVDFRDYIAQQSTFTIARI
jgi:hypothetical protein